MRNLARLLPIVGAALALAVAVPVASPAAASAKSAPESGTSALTASTQLARLGGGRAFGRRPSFGSRYRQRSRNQYRRARPNPFRGFFRGVLTALGISFLLHALFGWGAGGSPIGLLLLAAIVLWLITRRRRRVAAGGAWGR
jgi:hypothetical protein